MHTAPSARSIARVYLRSRVFAALGAIALGAALPQCAFAAEDTTPPGPPLNVMVEQGPAWQTGAEFDVTWENPPAQESPIAIAHYRLCPAAPLGPCTSYEAAGEGIEATSIVVPHIGWFWLQIWLEDTAGNVNINAKSDTAMLRFDNELPSPGRLVGPGGWLNAATSTNAVLTLETDPNGTWPLSGIGGYSVAVDDTPDETVDVIADQDNERWRATFAPGELSEGVNEIRIRAVSNAGLASLESGVSLIRIDRSRPEIEAYGVDGLEEWGRTPVEISLTGIDQMGLSGMDPAPLNQPVETGAYLSTSLDSGQTEVFRGSTAQVSVGSDGPHALTARAVDAAGNESDSYSWEFKIDRTRPRGSFDREDSADPRKVSVSVSDALSGIAGGHVEFRKAGGRFVRLSTSRAGGKLVARLDDLVLPPGEYEFRAVVDDVAGNRAVISQRVDGRPMALSLPVRTPTALSAEVRGATRRCTAARKRRKQARRPKKRCRTVTGGNSAAFGKGFASHGKLTGFAGRPLSGATIVIEGQPRSGGPFVRLGTARTDTAGQFRFSLPAGPSRTIRYRYEGTNTTLPSSAMRSTKVAAAARLSVNRRRVRNGQAVEFKGRLLGKPIPKAGKLVALQAKVGRGWRTFATPRANAKGAFTRRYRFTSTTGLRRYAFRALVTREAAYPYERGTSKTVRVTVRGR